ncbi:hypothetical protein HGA91_01155 [candidate division WWE3 bacterium]|nr:hypothetical protein [candidate division WWE3 bacterium]
MATDLPQKATPNKANALMRFLTATDQPTWLRWVVGIAFVINILIPDPSPLLDEILMAVWLYVAWRNSQQAPE